MGFSSARIDKIDNGYILRIDYTLSHDENYYKDSEEMLQVLKNVIQGYEKKEE